MANVSVPEQLSDSRYITLILRLLVDRSGELVHGDVGSQVAHESTVRGRFIQDVQAAEALSEKDKDSVLLVGLLALQGADDLEVR